MYTIVSFQGTLTYIVCQVITTSMSDASTNLTRLDKFAMYTIIYFLGTFTNIVCQEIITSIACQIMSPYKT